jgi:D-lactate dehydrogenase
MKVAVFSTKSYDRAFLEKAAEQYGQELTFFEERLNGNSAFMVEGFGGVCVFVNDRLDREVLEALSERGVRVVALRCAGFNNVDLTAAEELGMAVVRVPAYSPYSVAEHAAALMMSLNRQVHRAHNRVREGNFSLDGLLGFELHGRTVGIIGTGRIGTAVAQIMRGFGCALLASDPRRSEKCEEMGVRYVELEELFSESDVVTLHCPLMPETYHLIDEEAIARMKDGVMLINTSRGAIVDTRAAIRGLKSGKIGYLGLDVYEEEGDYFYEDLSNKIIQDDVLARLLTFPNVVVTGHQAFFTRTALENITQTTLENISDFEQDRPCDNRIAAHTVMK